MADAVGQASALRAGGGHFLGEEHHCPDHAQAGTGQAATISLDRAARMLQIAQDVQAFISA